MTPVSQTLYAFLQKQATLHPQKRLLGDARRWLDAETLLSRVEAAARHFLALGIRPGDLIGLPTRRSLDTAVAILGLQAAGAVAVLTDPRQEIPAFLSRCEKEIPLKTVIDPGTIPSHLPADNLPLPEVDPRTPGFIIFTSGSTGKPKAVMISQYNLVNNLVDSEPLGHYSPEDIALGALPMDHVFGLVLLAGVCVLGYSIFFPEKTDIPSLLSAIETEKITRMNGVPSLYLAMAQLGQEYDLASLKAGFIGGGPFTREQFCRIEEALSMTLIPVYGMSECIGIACADWKEPQAVRADGSAPFYSMNTGKILREDGSEAAVGETGEIFITGEARMVGYWPHQMPGEALLPTGDLGYLDENRRLHLTGRKKDIIIRNGNNISARSIEEAILSIPGVTDAAVVSMEHPTQGEVPGAMVCGNRSRGEILAVLTANLKKNEVPAKVLMVPALPRTPSGKPDKQKIREVLEAWKA